MLLRADGPHNAQNAAGAAALALTFGLDTETVLAGLAKVSPAFGRGQSFDIDGRRLVLQLVKNPAGFRQTLRTLDGVTGADAIVIAINDDYADGRDVSWLWDVDFSCLAAPISSDARRSTAGTRAADMAVRLRYDDIAVDEVEPDLEKAVRSAVEAVPAGGHVVVFSTYTAMWALHAILLRIGQAGMKLIHLYPREMNIYGDTGNVLVLQRRLQWRGLPVEVVPVSVGDPLPHDADILLGGGGQDAAQGEIGADFASRGAQLRAMADDGVVMLTICGTYQMLGHEFVTQEGRRIPGVGVLDVVTRGQAERLIGNNFVDTADAGRLVGYENHSGLTELGPGVATARQHPAGAGQQRPRPDRGRGARQRDRHLPARTGAGQEPTVRRRPAAPGTGAARSGHRPRAAGRHLRSPSRPGSRARSSPAERAARS